MSNKPKNITILRANKRAEKRIDSIDFLMYLINQKNCSDQQKIKIAEKIADNFKEVIK